ncbi:glycosyl transferase family 2 [Priestia megaterium]|uniref:glycosyltransferase family 2 protein n=1 Tax=Priestia megaterium TaxID=1404 RepID=UPI000BF5962B|nr:glycosyltransferase family 2 protein [Priestia megaterium]PET00263.1 glycosyl transferase family 2 [Priestia megaterium]
MENLVEPLVSVVIPTYNRGNIIENTINSVLNQTYSNLEIIIVDDCSNDNTEDVVKSFHDERIKYIKHTKNSNGSVARNTGIKNSNGEYIAFLDSDDEWFPEKIDIQLSYLLKQSTKNIVSYTQLIANRGHTQKMSSLQDIIEGEKVLDYLFVKNGTIQTSTLMLDSNLAKKVLFNEKLKRHQDWDFCNRLQKQGASFIFVKKPLTTWNLEYREDRVSNGNQYLGSLQWLNDNKHDMSKDGERAFLAKVVAPFMGRSNKKWEAMKYVFQAIPYKILSIKDVCYILFKVLFSLKTLNGLHYKTSVVKKFISIKAK